MRARFAAFAILVTLTVMSGSTLADTPLIEACEDEVVHSRDAGRLRHADTELILDRGADAGALVYVGVFHTRDAGHRQYARIEELVEIHRPTMMFFEGTGSGFSPERNETIRRRGEPSFVRLLASKAGTPAKSLEPLEEDTLAHLARHFPADQIFLFTMLRNVVGARFQAGIPSDRLEQTMEFQLVALADAALRAGIEPPFRDLEGLQHAYLRYWKVGSWRDASREWFNPMVPSEQTGGLFTNDINAVESHFRNLHMYRVLAAAVLAGERVLAVVGRTHVTLQAAALRCALAAK